MKADVTVHGFRSSFRNWAGDLTMFQREAIEECLGHQVGSSVERAYRRQSGLDKRRIILQAWASYVNGDESRAHDNREAA
jgi:integrase